MKIGGGYQSTPVPRQNGSTNGGDPSRCSLGQTNQHAEAQRLVDGLGASVPKSGEPVALLIGPLMGEAVACRAQDKTQAEITPLGTSIGLLHKTGVPFHG